MAHFAKIEDNIVTDIVVISNDEIKDANGNESEEIGVNFLKDAFGQDTVWKQTSYNNRIRKNYAIIGGTYDAERDAFISNKNYDSWVLNEETCEWEAPVPMPEDHETNPYRWDEENKQWVEFVPVETDPDLGEKP